MSELVFKELESLISIGNKDSVLGKLTEIKAEVDAGNAEYIEYISTPANLTRIQSKLCDDMGVFRRMLQLRRRIPNAKHRASMFLQAMLNGVGMLKDE